MTENRNRLWAMITNEQNLSESSKFEYSYACSDHILVISPTKPVSAVEIKDHELLKLLTQSDIAWIQMVGKLIEDKQISKQIEDQTKDVMSRFEDYLKYEMEGEIGNAEGVTDR